MYVNGSASDCKSQTLGGKKLLLLELKSEPNELQLIGSSREGGLGPGYDEELCRPAPCTPFKSSCCCCLLRGLGGFLSPAQHEETQLAPACNFNVKFSFSARQLLSNYKHTHTHTRFSLVCPQNTDSSRPGQTNSAGSIFNKYLIICYGIW